jgi:cyclophilin family peptidyl-prolyl cis-trans isomerase
MPSYPSIGVETSIKSNIKGPDSPVPQMGSTTGVPPSLGIKVEASSSSPSPMASFAPETTLTPDLTVDANGLSKTTVVMITSAGTIKFKFYSNDARQTVNRVIELIRKGFYNGLTFHRVVPGFVIQGGDPVGNGTGGSGQKLKAEFSDRKHLEGTLAMARAADPNSADSQFYICLGSLPHLDHNFTVFGQVVEGMEIVRKIKIGDKMLSFVIQ